MQNLVQINKKSFTSRSAILTHFTCPYKYFLTFEAEGSGFTSEKQNLDLLIGSVVHRGLQHLFEHCRKHKPDEQLSEACIDEAIEVAKELWEESLGKGSLWLHKGEEDRLDWILGEQECLFEGLIRAFAIYRLPDILEEYEILEIEHEEVSEDFSPTVTFLGKADGLFLRKADNKIVILSIKTTSEYAEVTTRNILHDMQGVSEWFLVQERLSKQFKEYQRIIHIENGQGLYDEFTTKIGSGLINYFLSCNTMGITPKVFAVQYEYLIKGQRKEDQRESGIYSQRSFLCHPYKLDSVVQIAFGRGGTTVIDPAKYKWNWGAGKQKKGWAKEDIWNDIGIKAWVEMLATGQVQPEIGHPFQNIIKTPDLIVRDEREIEEWLVSTRFLAENIFNKIETMNLLIEDGFKQELQKSIWKYFPKNTLQCHNYFGKDCEFVRHCHELESVEDMVNAGELINRIPHHDLEKQNFQEKGLIENV